MMIWWSWLPYDGEEVHVLYRYRQGLCWFGCCLFSFFYASYSHRHNQHNGNDYNKRAVVGTAKTWTSASGEKRYRIKAAWCINNFESIKQSDNRCNCTRSCGVVRFYRWGGKFTCPLCSSVARHRGANRTGSYFYESHKTAMQQICEKGLIFFLCGNNNDVRVGHRIGWGRDSGAGVQSAQRNEQRVDVIRARAWSSRGGAVGGCVHKNINTVSITVNRTWVWFLRSNTCRKQ